MDRIMVKLYWILFFLCLFFFLSFFTAFASDLPKVPYRQTGILIAESALKDEHIIRMQALRALRGSKIPMSSWSLVLSRVRIESVMVRQECDARHPRGCTISALKGEQKEPYAFIWYLRDGDEQRLRRVIIHELRHALYYAYGFENWKRVGHTE